MKRKTMPKKTDRKVFEITANKVHKSNLDTKFSKSGIRF